MHDIFLRFTCRLTCCIALRGACVIGLAGLLAGCIALPALPASEPRPSSAETIYSRDALNLRNTRLGKAIAPQIAAHPNSSGVVPLADGRDAFATRLALTEKAEKSLDVRYYIWRDDITGRLLHEALMRAADRGVQIRLLLDDQNTQGQDALLTELDTHPAIEVRLFNPFVLRNWRLINLAADFSRLNRRMHNKSFTADHQISIVGGRNIGDEYFSADGDVLFVDLDVLAVGPVVAGVSQDFERYWNSPSAYPLALLVDPASATRADDTLYPSLRASIVDRAPQARAFIERLPQEHAVSRLLAGEDSFQWGPVQMLSDDPAKALGMASEESLLSRQFRSVIGAARNEVQLVSPYFVPTRNGVAVLGGLTARGTRVEVLTNALESTDVPVVHAGYIKTRKALLEAGVRLFEMKRTAADAPSLRDLRLTGSSATSLHAKTFSVDRERLFIGSFNFDPRSARLNTEMGFIIDSPTIAAMRAANFAREMPQRAYEAKLDAVGKLIWVETTPTGTLIHTTEPGTGPPLRALVWLLSLLPIEGLL